jgi:hypothetical protein
LLRAGREIQIWNRNLIYSLVEMMILCAATTIIFMAMLAFSKALWHIYLLTPVGQKFASNASLLSNYTLAHLLSKDMAFFSLEVTATTLIACLMLSAICQLLSVRRLLYEGRGMAARFIWLLLFITVSAYILTGRSEFEFPSAVGLCVLPSVCVSATCLTVSDRLLPELTPGAFLELTRKLMCFITRPE